MTRTTLVFGFGFLSPGIYLRDMLVERSPRGRNASSGTHRCISANNASSGTHLCSNVSSGTYLYSNALSGSSLRSNGSSGTHLCCNVLSGTDLHNCLLDDALLRRCRWVHNDVLLHKSVPDVASLHRWVPVYALLQRGIPMIQTGLFKIVILIDTPKCVTVVKIVILTKYLRKYCVAHVVV